MGPKEGDYEARRGHYEAWKGDLEAITGTQYKYFFRSVRCFEYFFSRPKFPMEKIEKLSGKLAGSL